MVLWRQAAKSRYPISAAALLLRFRACITLVLARWRLRQARQERWDIGRILVPTRSHVLGLRART